MRVATFFYPNGSDHWTMSPLGIRILSVPVFTSYSLVWCGVEIRTRWNDTRLQASIKSVTSIP
jgi:hypothetical protein